MTQISPVEGFVLARRLLDQIIRQKKKRTIGGLGFCLA